MPSKKSAHACRFSIEAMSANLPNLYMWTFTWADVLDIEEASIRWKRFLTQPDGWCAAFPYMSGIRVFEIHPGADPFMPDLSHGLHVHAVIDRRVPVDITRSIWNRKKGGRLHVKAIPAEKAMYIGKYLAKQRVECLKGRRLWAPFGKCEASKVKDIVVDTRWTATYQFMATVVNGFSRLRWDQRARLVSQFVFSEDIHGAFASIGMEENLCETPEEHEHSHVVREVVP